MSIEAFRISDDCRPLDEVGRKLLEASLKPADPFSLEALIAWLEKQPADETYCFLDTGACLFGRYGYEMGFRKAGLGSPSPYGIVTNGMSARYGQPETVEPFEGRISSPKPHTFGAALDRARAAFSPPPTSGGAG